MEEEVVNSVGSVGSPIFGLSYLPWEDNTFKKDGEVDIYCDPYSRYSSTILRGWPYPYLNAFVAFMGVMIFLLPIFPKGSIVSAVSKQSPGSFRQPRMIKKLRSIKDDTSN
eukprot:TRINITY_DN8160_c0_g1_i2.p1 TRINITY_DN8160_c0_g1~~TRINITY_DN8160_c0_g1_i2.p1  ORF type:complete len:111 (-),score=21.66 TRINITY_DN8160_c0_g1_i2:16-348(-)